MAFEPHPRPLRRCQRCRAAIHPKDKSGLIDGLCSGSSDENVGRSCFEWFRLWCVSTGRTADVQAGDHTCAAHPVSLDEYIERGGPRGELDHAL